MSSIERAVDLLRQLGLNQLESDVYAFLLQHPPMTAYRVGKMLGRPTANVYKAIESLARRGAVLIEEGESRLCRAISAEEFLTNVESRFLRTTHAAVDALSDLQRPIFDERVYRVESVPALFDRARSMLSNASSVAIVDAFPKSLDALRNEITEAIDRGVFVLVKGYAPIEIEGADVVIGSDPKATMSAWVGEQLNVVVDGRELLVALLDSEISRIDQAIWSGSLYLACSLHAGLSAEHTLVKLRLLLGEDPSLQRVTGVIRGHRFLRDGLVPGYRDLIARLRNDDGDIS